MSILDDSVYQVCYRGNKHRALTLANQENVKYVFSDTPLHQACRQGWMDVVKPLIEKHGCDPNVITVESLLHYAC